MTSAEHTEPDFNQSIVSNIEMVRMLLQLVINRCKLLLQLPSLLSQHRDNFIFNFDVAYHLILFVFGCNRLKRSSQSRSSEADGIIAGS
jgi:hypothetical protein|tara:strand:+ start:1734 stop:2000 length:267 start_codon:yes stop_codon:yes gene_type:complete